MTISTRLLLTGLAGAALLAGCNQADKKNASDAEQDPAVTGALDGQIMTDPELSSQNGAAVAAGGAAVELPPEQRSPEAIAAARQEAAKLVGGTIENVPQASTGAATSLAESAATAAQVAEATRSASTDCASKVEYSADWAARLPKPLAVYPRGAVQEAAGVNGGGCALNVVTFVTPVQPRDVLGYYYTGVRKAGYDAQYRMDGSDHVLGGKSGGKAYVVYARTLDNGLTEVDLVATGQ